MTTYTPHSLETAFSAVSSGTPRREAARTYNIPFPTLLHRMNITPTRQLTETEEAEILNWIVNQSAVGLPPTNDNLCQMGSLFIQDEELVLGERWLAGFREKYSNELQVQTLKLGLMQEPPSKSDIALFLDDLNGDKYKDYVIWNMGEFGITTSETESGLISNLTYSELKIKQQREQKFVNCVEVVCSDGHSVSPIVIFNGEASSLISLNLLLDPEPVEFTEETAPGAEPTLLITFKWLRAVFQKELKKFPDDQKHLLVMNHNPESAFCTADFRLACFKKGAETAVIPPAVDHLCQPLDALLPHLRNDFDAPFINTLDREVHDFDLYKRAFIKDYVTIRAQALAAQKVTAAFDNRFNKVEDLASEDTRLMTS